jgi:hypothetical protein
MKKKYGEAPKGKPIKGKVTTDSRRRPGAGNKSCNICHGDGCFFCAIEKNELLVKIR